MISRPEGPAVARDARRGTSLLEVLVGLGIMAVGAIGAFVLFPLSAINVSRALIDDRTTTCAITADGQMRDFHRMDVERATASGSPAPVGEFYHAAMDSPLPTAAPLLHEPSMPAFVDPMGFYARTGPGQYAVGDAGQTTIPRVNLSITNNLANGANLALRFCSQMDGLTYTDGGNVPGGVDMRELRYNWLWVLQRPVQRDRYTVRMQVVVFDKRVHLYAPPGTEAVLGPNVTFVPGTTSITNVPGTAEVRKGSWVMDGTVKNTSDPVTPTAGATGAGSPPAAPRVIRPLRHAEFYRVTSVTEVGGTYTLEVHKPIVRADGYSFAARPEEYQYTGTLVVMPTVVEVFERPTLTGGAQ